MIHKKILYRGNLCLWCESHKRNIDLTLINTQCPYCNGEIDKNNLEYSNETKKRMRSIELKEIRANKNLICSVLIPKKKIINKFLSQIKSSTKIKFGKIQRVTMSHKGITIYYNNVSNKPKQKKRSKETNI